MEHPPEAITVSVKKAGDMLGLSTWQVKQRCDAGLIKSGYSGRTRLVDVESLKAYAASLPAERPDIAI